MLLCMWAALRWLDTSRPELLVLAYVGAFVGVFSHENGILLLPLLIGLLFITHRTTPLPKLAIVVVPVGALVLIYTALWWSFRPQDGTALSDSVQGGAAMLLQGLIYPVVMAVRPFVSGDADVMTILLLVILTTGLVMLLVGMQNRRRLLPVSYGLGWYVLAVLPAAIFLPAGYVLGQPRLALLASVGGSLFWTMALVAVLSSWNMLGKILFLFVVGGMLLLSFEFLSMRRAEFLRLRDFNREAVTLLETNRAFEADTVMVNMPDYLTPPEYKRRFLLGTEGVLFVDETLDYSQQFTMNSSFNFDSVDVIAYPSIQRSEGFGFRAHPPVLDRQRVVDSVHDAEQVYVTQFDTREFYPVLVGGTALTDGALTDGEFAVFEGGNLRLNSGEYNLHEDVIVVSTTWTVAQPSAVKLFVHVYCDESFIAQSDGYPWGDTYPFLYWQVGETQTDIRQIALESDYNEDCLQVFAGLYYESDITRLEAVAPEGVAPYIDNLVPLTRAS